MARIAIIGAGMAGLTAAHRLADRHDITVFERADRAGGRMASRPAGDFIFDHGAQFFTAKSADFQKFLSPYIASGALARWDAAFAEFSGPEITGRRQWDAKFGHYVGAPDMNALPQAIAASLNIRFACNIESIRRNGNLWQLYAREQLIGEFDWVISSLPAKQSSALFEKHTRMLSKLPENLMQPCYALMLGFNTPQDLEWQAAHVKQADISWISVNSSKPGHNGSFSMLVLATNAWTRSNFELDLNAAGDHLLSEVERIAGIDRRDLLHQETKRWTYVNLNRQTAAKAYLDKSRQLAACGDWCIQGRVEAAFTSANWLARKLNSLI
ncbi:MAG TPA: FAD-dependent oxidoreductase [Methylophaga sp.]|nr:FAD-dependent oxidoreductase [Methylophaga sp.]